MPLMPRWPARTEWERFLAHVRIIDHADCWEWQGKLAKGYGYFKLSTGKCGGTHIIAHRFAYLYAHPDASIDGLHLDHLCSNARCVNPAHLDPCSASENARRSWRRGRHR